MKSFFIQIQAAANPHSNLAVSFEVAVRQLESLPRMFIEWDGSFVWRGDCENSTAGESSQWQLDGMVYDHLGAIQYLELKGCCTQTAWHQLLTILGWPEQPLIIHHVDEGRFESLDTFSFNYIG
jgi:hypothetical protein